MLVVVVLGGCVTLVRTIDSCQLEILILYELQTERFQIKANCSIKVNKKNVFVVGVTKVMAILQNNIL